MDQIITPLLNQGITGVMAAAFIYFCWHVLTRTIPEQRVEFLAALKEYRNETLAAMAEQRESTERSLERISSSLDHVTNEVRAMREDRQRDDRQRAGK